MSWRRRTRDFGLLFFGSIGSYFTALLLAAQLSPWLASMAETWTTLVGRLLLGVAALDLSKAPGLLLVAAVIGRGLGARPWIASGLLVAMVYLYELAVSAVLGQLPWLFAEPLVLVLRVAAAVLLVALTALVLRRVRHTGRAGTAHPPAHAGGKDSKKTSHS